MRIRKLPAVKERVETGPIQFDGDWPGVFIRGDEAFALSQALTLLIQDREKVTKATSLKPAVDYGSFASELVCDLPVKGLLKLLQSSDLNRRQRRKIPQDPQRLILPRDTGKYLELIEKAHEDAAKSKLVFKSVNGRGQEFSNQ